MSKAKLVSAGGAWKRTCQEGTRQADGRLSFTPEKGSDAQLCDLVASFRPLLTPKEVLHAGAFGGTYFRDIDSTATGKHHRDAWAELPTAWLRGLDISRQVARPWAEYDPSVNKYGVRCGNTLEDWEKSRWILAQDPYGWFQWYCRFYLGRRTSDDARQISRWLNVCGPSGRWKGNLVAKCLKQGRPYNDATVAPVVRQSLVHWAYELTAGDFRERKGHILGGKGAYAMPGAELKTLHRQGRAASGTPGPAVRKRPAAVERAAKRQKGA